MPSPDGNGNPTLLGVDCNEQLENAPIKYYDKPD